jgi:hypothetical protein
MAPTAAFSASMFFQNKISANQNQKNEGLRNQQLIVQKKIPNVVVTFFYLLSLSSH